MPPATTAAVLDTIATSAGDSTAAFDDGAAWYVVFDVEMLLSRTVHPVIPVSFRSACRSSSSAGDTAFTAQFTVLITSDVLQLSVNTHWIPTSTSHDPLDDSAYSNTAIFDASTHSSRARSATHDFGSAPAYVTVSTIRSELVPPLFSGNGAGISRHSSRIFCVSQRVCEAVRRCDGDRPCDKVWVREGVAVSSTSRDFVTDSLIDGVTFNVGVSDGSTVVERVRDSPCSIP